MAAGNMTAIRKCLYIMLCIICSMLAGLLYAGDDIRDNYYPLTKGDTWEYRVYEVNGKDKSFSQTVTVEGKEEYNGIKYDILQQKDKRGVVDSFCIKDKKGVFWKKISARKSYTPRASSVFTPQLPIMMFPLEVGAQWDWKGTLKIAMINKNITMHCSVVAEEVIEVPAGRFKCIKIHIHQLRNKEVSDEYGWYSPGVGQVKYVGKELAKELVKYKLAER